MIQSDSYENMKDAYSGTLIKTSVKNENNELSLMMNTDGICLKKSGSNSVWPLQIICNFLPPRIRYLNENIICTSFYCKDHKPEMLTFLEPFANELERLQSDGFVFKGQVFRAAVTCAVLDLPAKASFQQVNQHNGYFACGYCLNEGEYIEGCVRYTWSDEGNDMRTNKSFLIAMDNILKKKTEMENGIKGLSPAVSFNYFDMVKSFGLDYLHCVLLGVMRNLEEFWLCPSKQHDSYISPKQQNLLNMRIRSIKPCRCISRLPRSLQFRKLFKASEHRSLLLYYFPVVLNGFLQKKYLDHFHLLSGSIYILLTTNISSSDIDDVEKNLNIFVKQYQEFYGKKA